ncbi:hypothetical protein WG66_013116 [Moniliophthora roreri]|nr:hypothetical protein WG66_013116 [Moniliophthora roreri]
MSQNMMTSDFAKLGVDQIWPDVISGLFRVYYARSCPALTPRHQEMDNTSLIEGMTEAFLARYIAAVSLVIIVYDHLLTLDREVLSMWRSRDRGLAPKIIWALNRYFSEAIVAYIAYVELQRDWMMLCDRFVWVFAVSSTLFISTTHFIIVLRLFNLWGPQKRTAAILISGFVIALATALGLVVYIILQVKMHYLPPPFHTCFFLYLPKSLPSFLAIWLGFDTFLFIVAFYNALERPHRTNVEVIDIVLREGALLLLAAFGIRLIPLVLTIVGNPVQAFGSMNILWVVDSIVSSRIHLRVEDLRHLKFPTHPEGLGLELQGMDDDD